MNGRDHIPYYYGLNYEAPEGAGPPPVAALGGMLGNVYRKDAIGADNGLWYQSITGRPLDASRFQVDFGGEEKPDTASDWTSYHTAPESAGMLLDTMFGEGVRAAGRVGGALRGEGGYEIDEINDPKTVARAKVKDVLDALSLYSGPGILAGKPSASGLSVFGGLRAANPKVRMQQVAEVALAAGKDPNEVWKLTGWRKGSEGAWKFEIDDSKALFVPERMREGDAVKLPDVFKHERLFEQYPELAQVKVRYGHPESMEGLSGVFDPKSNAITLKPGGTPEKIKGTLLHEIQHWVQKKEGFAFGTKYDPRAPSVYNWSAGEIEARDVRDRMGFGPEQRRETAPWDPPGSLVKRYDDWAGRSEQVDVWHGSPHRFDKMSLEKVGTGEGGQAFGYGLYFTDKEAIARHYAKSGARKIEQVSGWNINGKKILEGDVSGAEQSVLNNYANGLTTEQIIERNISRRNALQKTQIPEDPDSVEALKDAISATYKAEQFAKELHGKKIEFWSEKAKPNLYKAQLFPGKDPSEYTFLDWYEEPSKKLMSAISDMVEPHPIKKFRDEGRYAWKGTDQGISSASEVYHKLSEKLGSDREASAFLKRAGIDGIRYPTETLHGKPKTGRSEFNYVVFDDKDIRLVERESGGIVEKLKQMEVEEIERELLR
jgi:hypothetical protein